MSDGKVSDGKANEGGGGPVRAYCDGACRGNPGVGGYGAIIVRDGSYRELKHAEAHTTNNRMELGGAIAVLRETDVGSEIVIMTDSQYVVRGMNEWLPNWVRRGWKTASRKPVLNQDLWKELSQLAAARRVRWEWVQGHAGHTENERCDELANQAVDEFLAR